MRLMVDATAIPAARGGVGRYVDGLVPALAAELGAVRVVCQPRDAEAFAAVSGVDVVPIKRIARRPARLAWEQSALALLIGRLRPDVVHCPHYTMPVASPVPVVVALHDATFFTDPSVHSRVKGPFFRAATRVALRRAQRCIVPSAATRSELVRSAGARAEDLVVAHHGVDPTHFAPPAVDDVSALRARLGLGEVPFVAFLGTLEPRKNVPALVRGFAAAVGGRTDGPALVLAGEAGWDREVAGALAAAAGLPGVRILRPGYLPLADVPALLGGAAVVAYPSLDEGFGLPVLEAMSCAAAVLTTRRGALPEVGGDAVAYAGTDAGSIGAALRSLLDDGERRAALSRAARSRAAGFTWSASAEAHLAAFRAAVGVAA